MKANITSKFKAYAYLIETKTNAGEDYAWKEKIAWLKKDHEDYIDQNSFNGGFKITWLKNISEEDFSSLHWRKIY